MNSVKAVATGIRAGLRAPLLLRGRALEELVRDPGNGVGLGEVPATALRAARGTVAWMGRLRVPGYRNSCLYRCAAECAVARSYGARVWVVLGARRDKNLGIRAHAWLEPQVASRGAGSGGAGEGGDRYRSFRTGG